MTNVEARETQQESPEYIGRATVSRKPVLKSLLSMQTTVGNRAVLRFLAPRSQPPRPPGRQRPPSLTSVPSSLLVHCKRMALSSVGLGLVTFVVAALFFGAAGALIAGLIGAAAALVVHILIVSLRRKRLKEARP